MALNFDLHALQSQLITHWATFKRLLIGDLLPLEGSSIGQHVQESAASVSTNEPSPHASVTHAHTVKIARHADATIVAKSDAIFEQGIQAAQEHQLEEAKKLFQEALKIDSTQTEAWYNLALLHKHLEDMPSALHCVRLFLQQLPGDLDGEMLYLRLILEQPKYLQTRNETLLMIGSCCNMLPQEHMMRPILELFTKVLELDSAKSMGRLNVSEETINEHLATIDELLKHIDSHPLRDEWFQTLLFMKATVLRQLDRLPEAIATYMDLLVLNPNHIEGVYQLSLLFAQYEDWHQVEELNYKVLEAYPDHHQALNQLGLAQFALENLEACVDTFKRAIELAPQELIYKNNLAYAYEKMGRIGEALRLLEEVLNLETDPSIKEEIQDDIKAIQTKYNAS
ncbi:MAG: tetratricopeptide repeat protein [Vampirovibrionales bacterium]